MKPIGIKRKTIKREVPKWLVDAVEQAELDTLSDDADTLEIPAIVLHDKGWRSGRNLVVMKQKYFENLLKWLEGGQFNG